MSKNPNQIVQFIQRFTEAYLNFHSEEIEKRELACLRIQYPFILEDLEPGDLFVGRISHLPVGFSPQMGNGFAFYYDEQKTQVLLNDPQLSKKNKNIFRDLCQFWQCENTAAQTRRVYPQHMSQLLPSDNWNGESGIAFPLYRMSGSNLDYKKLISLGIQGLRKEINYYKTQNKSDNSQKLYFALLNALDLISDVCLWYKNNIENLLTTVTRKTEKANYIRIIKALEHISEFPPIHFFEALQLFWLYALLSGNVDYGRFDKTFVVPFSNDIKSGFIDSQDALDMLVSLWKLMNSRENGIWIFDSRVIIGGKGREKEADELALLCIEATRQTRQIIPQLSLRFSQEQNPELYDKALECIAENNPYPMFYNDDINIPSVSSAFDVSMEEAENYCPFGCGEYILEHRSFGTPSGVINLLQALLVTLNHGKNPVTGKTMGISESDIGLLDTFENLWSAYTKQVDLHVQTLADQEKLEYVIAGQTAPFLYFTLLFDSCLERGKAIFDGGVEYLGGTLETYGNSNTADSLLALKKWVYERELFSLGEMRKMLLANFGGFAKERKILLNTPKYGNDNKEADDMLVKIDNHVFTVARNQRFRADLSSYLVVIINNNANTVMGRYTSASPDGRLSFTPMNNGNAPSSGMDKNGITSFLNSIVKPSTTNHAGAVQNMKFSKELFCKHLPHVKNLLQTYWDIGGAQAMLNVIGKEDLHNALKYPENYRNLIVRVGGYSAIFVDLEPDIQHEILSRTLY